jgi:hypothetical protein
MLDIKGVRVSLSEKYTRKIIDRNDSNITPSAKNITTHATLNVSSHTNCPPKIPYTRRTTGTLSTINITANGNVKYITSFTTLRRSFENSSSLPIALSLENDGKDAIAKDVPKLSGKAIKRTAYVYTDKEA